MKRGPKTKYDPDKTPQRIKELAKAGGRDVDIAKALGIAKATLNNWKHIHPEIMDSLKEGKDDVDDKVVCALLKNALGYKVCETKRFYRPLFASNGDPVIGKDGKQVKALIREEATEKDVQPSTVAQIFWLKNRRPDDWRQGTETTDWSKAKGEINQLFEQMKEEKVAGST